MIYIFYETNILSLRREKKKKHYPLLFKIDYKQTISYIFVQNVVIFQIDHIITYIKKCSKILLNIDSDL